MSKSIFDDNVVGEIETSVHFSDVVEMSAEKVVSNDEYGDTYYFFAAKIHPSFALFISSASREMVDKTVGEIQKKLRSKNPQKVAKIQRECMQTLSGCSIGFEKYSHKGGARELEKYSREGKQEYKDFCNDIVLYFVYLKAFLGIQFSLWDKEQLKTLGLVTGLN